MEPSPSLAMNLSSMSCTFQATPATPRPLLPTAPTMPEVCVPWPPTSSAGGHAHRHRIQPVEAVRLRGRPAARGVSGRRPRAGIHPKIGLQVLVREKSAGVEHTHDDIRGGVDGLPTEFRVDIRACDAAVGACVAQRAHWFENWASLGTTGASRAAPDMVRLHVLVAARRHEPGDRGRHRVAAREEEDAAMPEAAEARAQPGALAACSVLVDRREHLLKFRLHARTRPSRYPCESSSAEGAPGSGRRPPPPPGGRGEEGARPRRSHAGMRADVVSGWLASGGKGGIFRT